MLSMLSGELRNHLEKHLKYEELEHLNNEIISYKENALKDKSGREIRVKIIIAAIGIAGFASIMGIGLFASGLKAPSELGTFGDFLNGITTPFISAGAFIAAYLAYKNQNKQLELQKEEINKQRIENNFFQLIQIHTEIVKNLTYDDKQNKDNPIIGPRYFKKIHEKLVEKYEEELKNSNDQINIFPIIMNRLDDGERDQLTHYFKNLFQIYKLVNDNRPKLTEEEQKGYIDIINAQLSSIERDLLYFNTQYYGHDGFYQILANYNCFTGKFRPEKIEERFKDKARLKETIKKVQEDQIEGTKGNTQEAGSGENDQ
ncbi:putative phage abortive infection protein [Cytobacillus firmus]